MEPIIWTNGVKDEILERKKEGSKELPTYKRKKEG
jgi:hypothetical protein